MKYKKLIESVLEELNTIDHEVSIDPKKVPDENDLFLILQAIRQVWRKSGQEIIMKGQIKDVKDAVELILDGDKLIRNAGLFGICPKLKELIDTGKNKKMVKDYLLDNSNKWFDMDPINSSQKLGIDLLDEYQPQVNRG